MAQTVLDYSLFFQVVIKVRGCFSQCESTKSACVSFLVAQFFFFFFSLQKKKKKTLLCCCCCCEMQSFLAQLRSLPPAGPKTIRFFDRKDFLSVYGADAEFVADKFNKTRSTIKYLSEGEHALASQNVTARLLPEMLRRLVREENYAFEIWAVGPKSGNWELASKGSPGNFDEGEFGEQDDERAQGPGIMAALHVGKEGGATIVGVAYVDVLRSVIGVAQFADVESLANAETALMQLGASECVIPKDNGR